MDMSTPLLRQACVLAHPPDARLLTLSAYDTRCVFVGETGMRKTLLKTIRMYHEDKNAEREHGLEWHLLCREITKLLNSKLTFYT